MPAPPPLHRLVPGPSAVTTVAEAYAVARPTLAERPWVGVCMITSLDGSVVFNGTSGNLGNVNDVEVLLTLREVADVVIVGNTTARGEGYGAPASGVRIGVVTNSGRVDADSDLFRSGAGFVITHELADVPPGVEVLRAGHDELDLRLALAHLDRVVGSAHHVHAEGGPTLNGALHAAGLVDEFNLTTAPMMVAGRGSRAGVGDDEIERRFDLAHLLVDDDGYVFCRWVRRDAPDGAVS